MERLGAMAHSEFTLETKSAEKIQEFLTTLVSFHIIMANEDLQRNLQLLRLKRIEISF